MGEGPGYKVGLKGEGLKKSVVYTAIFGDYDRLRDPARISEDCDYVCLTDNAGLTSKRWKIVAVPEDGTPAGLKDRKVKILAHRYFPEYENSLYIDGNITLAGDASHLVNKYLDKGVMALSRHRDRDCIYEEAAICLQRRKGDAPAIARQIAKYRAAGYPDKNGLYANNVLLRKHNSPEVIRVMEDWWSEVQKESNRDQISFPFIARKNNFTPEILEEGPYGGQGYFIKRAHKRPFKGAFWQCVGVLRSFTFPAATRP